MTQPDQPLMTTDEVATLLRMKPETVQGWVRDEKLRAIRIGREFRFLRADVDEFMESRVVKAPAEKA